MGILFSRFRKKASTKEKLEEIEQELEDIEDFRFSTQQLQRRWVGRLIIFSVIVYLFGALLFFLYFFPSELSKQLLYSLPLLVFPLIVYALKWLLHLYYAYKLTQNTDQMVLLQRKKKKLLKEVMTTETYVVAKEILEKYDPDQIRQKAGIIPFSTSNVSTVVASLPENGVRRRSMPTRTLPTQPIKALPRSPNLIRPGYNAPPGTVTPQVRAASGYPGTIGVRPQRIPLPCPILPRQRGTIDRLVEFVVGDGPSNRYALICRQCQSHNGMALREEFEYIGFRCCYCFSLNPARKQRPLAPRLPTSIVPTITGAAGDKSARLDEESSTDGLTETTSEDGGVGQQTKEGSTTDDIVKSSSSLQKEAETEVRIQAEDNAELKEKEPPKIEHGSGDFTAEADEILDADLAFSEVSPPMGEVVAKRDLAAIVESFMDDVEGDAMREPNTDVGDDFEDGEVITMTSQLIDAADDDCDLTSQSDRRSEEKVDSP